MMGDMWGSSGAAAEGEEDGENGGGSDEQSKIVHYPCTLCHSLTNMYLKGVVSLTILQIE